ncbi:MAG: hypothetical protein LVQ95_01745 [Candidatus Micrarchaeales archaeon]|nr:hypothetical protein [Candidatus Micrarchaeales archaeon]
MANQIALALVAAAVVLGSAASYYYFTTGQVLPAPPHPIYCGTISSHGSGAQPFSQNFTKVAKCFYDAYANGDSAMFNLYYMGVDTGQNNNFTIASGSRNVTDRVTGFMNTKQTAPYTIYCTSVSIILNTSINATASSSLLISSCSNGASFLIPDAIS